MNKYLLIAAVWAVTFAGAAWWGYDYRDAKVAQELVDHQTKVLKKAADDAEQDKQEAIARVRAEAAAQARARAAKSQGVQDAALKARPDCGRDDASLGLLNAAILAANGAPTNTRGMSQELRTNPQPGRR